MTRERANLILEAARRGWPIPDWAITDALILTGDLNMGDVMRQVVRFSWDPIDIEPQSWMGALCA